MDNMVPMSPEEGEELVAELMEQGDEMVGYAVLEGCKNEIVHLLALGDTIMMGIAKKVDEISAKSLFRFDINPDTDRPYRSMREYLPDLVKEMRQRARLHKLSVRQVQEYIALYKVFVRGLGVEEEEIMRLGPSHFTEIREALDYNSDTGQAKSDALAREGKIGAETALRYVEEMRESGGEVKVKDLRDALDEKRGVERSYITGRWALVSKDNDEHKVVELTAWFKGVPFPITLGGRETAVMPLEAADWLSDRLGIARPQ